MESFGKSSLKAERKEWENDPNVAASVDICNPWFLCESVAWTQRRRKREEPGASRIPRQTSARNHPSTNIHPEPGDKMPLLRPRRNDLPGYFVYQTSLSQSPNLQFPSPNLVNLEASELTGDDNRPDYNQTSIGLSIHRLRRDRVVKGQIPAYWETQSEVLLRVVHGSDFWRRGPACTRRHSRPYREWLSWR